MRRGEDRSHNDILLSAAGASFLMGCISSSVATAIIVAGGGLCGWQALLYGLNEQCAEADDRVLDVLADGLADETATRQVYQYWQGGDDQQSFVGAAVRVSEALRKREWKHDVGWVSDAGNLDLQTLTCVAALCAKTIRT